MDEMTDMTKKEIIVPIYIKAGQAVNGRKEQEAYMSGDAVALAEAYDHDGADALLVFDLSEGDAEHDQSIGLIKKMARTTDIPLYGGGNIRRMEDVKKLLYAGCRKVFLNYAKEGNVTLTEEVSKRFGREKILACVRNEDEFAKAGTNIELLGGVVLPEHLLCNGEKTDAPVDFAEVICVCGEPEESGNCAGTPKDVEKMTARLRKMISADRVTGLCAPEFMAPDYPLMEFKHALKARGIPVNVFEASIAWEDIRTNSDGLLPVVVQDYKTQEVLMVAYMNREAFETTVATGRMTYFSRSRQELWVKGLTSGHFQYVKELRIDCDDDTLLAKVAQVGAACHTGNRSCFYRTVLKKEYDETNPLKVFEDVFAVIEDRKLHPKEGSYTNYLFEKGIDKILKKVGEEATEIVIAAKNPDPEEIKYEISDFLYHVMVLMAEKGVTWEDITEELARR